MSNKPTTPLLPACPFKVGDRVRYKREIRGNWPEATVTEITERGFRYEYDNPHVLGTRIGSSPGGEAYENSFNSWELVSASNEIRVPLQSEIEAIRERRARITGQFVSTRSDFNYDDDFMSHAPADIDFLLTALTALTASQQRAENAERNELREQLAQLQASSESKGTG